MNRNYACVLFDLDGTLSDSIELILMAYRHTMKIHLGHELPDNRWLAGIGLPLDVQLSEFARTPDEIVAMRHTYSLYYVERHDTHISMFPGAMEAVASLRSQGILTGMVTSKSRIGANRTIRRFDLAGYFDVIVSADDTAQGKPHPDPVLWALKKLNAAPETAAFVGDSPHDLKSGQAAGVDSIAVEWGPYAKDILQALKPTKWLKKPADIANLGK